MTTVEPVVRFWPLIPCFAWRCLATQNRQRLHQLFARSVSPVPQSPGCHMHNVRNGLEWISPNMKQTKKFTFCRSRRVLTNLLRQNLRNECFSFRGKFSRKNRQCELFIINRKHADTDRTGPLNRMQSPAIVVNAKELYGLATPSNSYWPVIELITCHQ